MPAVLHVIPLLEGCAVYLQYRTGSDSVSEHILQRFREVTAVLQQAGVQQRCLGKCPGAESCCVRAKCSGS